ncbi:MAG: hypothetical protein QF464_23620, partial [Myxococcota bacterium]|nr:hypothetical protein [Myxococcota bacterium]
MVLRAALAAVIMVALVAPRAQAEVPGELHYQGYLTTAAGEPVHCPNVVSCDWPPFALTFRLFGGAAGGEPLWEEVHEAVPIVMGIFDVQLGSLNPLEPTTLSGPCWLSIAVHDGAEMTPRQRLVSVPFALSAGHAATADLAALAEDATRLGGADAEDYARLSELPGLCVSHAELTAAGYLDAEALGIYLTDQGYVPG